MVRIQIKEQIFNFIALLVVQLPLLYRITLFDRAFAFFYVGFLLLLPFKVPRVYLLIAGFFVGLLVDIFSNTPGIHASACVLIMFFRNLWLSVTFDDLDELTNINRVTLGSLSFTIYIFPLVFLHHIVIFAIENGGFHHFGLLISKVFFSSVFSFMLIFVLNYLIAPVERRT